MLYLPCLLCKATLNLLVFGKKNMPMPSSETLNLPHEPCLYSETINGNHIIFKRQVNYFAIAAPDKKIANILIDMIDDHLTIPLKRKGLPDMFDGINIPKHAIISKLTATHISTNFAKIILKLRLTKS
jgi:hypothetical protein